MEVKHGLSLSWSGRRLADEWPPFRFGTFRRLIAENKPEREKIFKMMASTLSYLEHTATRKLLTRLRHFSAVGSDGRSRVNPGPWWTATGRSQA